ncbi:MAG: VIT1/CCC1 transporter family protein [Cellvibrionaceae bacterium]
MSHREMHRIHRVGWLRAAVLGANDGIVSTASLIIGVASAHVSYDSIFLTGVAGLVAGAMSMAAGEYVSVSSQADTEKADLALEKNSLENNVELEQQELADIYEGRGLEKTLAQEVAKQLMDYDALGAHAREELGIFEHAKAKPMQAAISSALAFTVGALLPLLSVWFAPLDQLISIVAFTSLLSLSLLGGLAAYIGGASIVIGITRVVFWGAIAMALTAFVGKLFGVAV